MIRTVLCILVWFAGIWSGNPAVGLSQPASERGASALPVRTAIVDSVVVRHPDPVEADAYLAASRFDYGNRVAESESLFQRIMRRVMNTLFSIPRAAGPMWDVLVWGIFGLIVIFAMLRLLGADFTGVVSGRRSALPDTPEVSSDVVTDYESAAVEAEQAGDLRSALRWRYVHLLTELDASGHITLRRDKTNDLLAHEIGNPAVRSDFNLLTDQFEASWYGAHTPDDAQYRNTVALVGRIRQQTEASPAAHVLADTDGALDGDPHEEAPSA